ncbi:MAG: succinate dehydrogenase, hydrophobic membrane anchor protein [Rhodospirillales bacterium]
MADLRSPLSRVRGLGSAKEGTHHWWAQRLTALALVPLVIWFVVSVVSLSTADYVVVRAWVGSPISMVLLVLTIGLTFHHGQLGLQVVIEDYIHSEWQKLTLLILVKGVALLLAVVGIVAIARIAFGG